MFKKLNLFMLWIVLFTTSFTISNAGDLNTCSRENITPQQEQTMKNIYNIFNNYQSAIEIKYPWTNFLVLTYLDNLNDTLNCLSPIEDFAEFEYDTIMLLKSIKNYDPEIVNLWIEYNDSLVAIQLDALVAYDEYDTLVEETELWEDFTPVEAKRIRTIDIINQLKQEMLEIWSYKDDPYLLNAFLENLNSLTDSLENEEKKLIELYISRSKIEGDLPEDEIIEEDELLNAIYERDDQAYIDIIEAQENFAEEYDFELED